MKRRQFLKAASVTPLLPSAAGVAEGATQEALPESQSRPLPTLGSHWETFKKLSDRCKPRMSFLQPEFSDPETWAQQARSTLIGDFHYDPPIGDFHPEVVETVDCGDYTRERVLINTSEDIRIPVYVLIPKQRKEKLPAVVVLHDHGGFYFWGKEKVVQVEPENPVLTEFKQEYYSGRSVADELAKRGYVSIAPDMLHWGERGMMLEEDPARIKNRTLEVDKADVEAFNARSWAHEEILGRTALTVGATWSGMIAFDDRRVADYLLSRPEVDPDRVGCCGLSVGAVRTLFLGALHPKVRVSVPVCWMSEYQPMAETYVKYIIGFTKLVPGLYNDLDWPDLAGLHYPGALMTINGLKDQIYPLEAAQAATLKVQRIFEKMGAPDRYEAVYFEGPHQFNAEMQEKAFAWFDRFLKQ